MVVACSHFPNSPAMPILPSPLKQTRKPSCGHKVPATQTPGGLITTRPTPCLRGGWGHAPPAGLGGHLHKRARSGALCWRARRLAGLRGPPGAAWRCLPGSEASVPPPGRCPAAHEVTELGEGRMSATLPGAARRVIVTVHAKGGSPLLESGCESLDLILCPSGTSCDLTLGWFCSYAGAGSLSC